MAPQVFPTGSSGPLTLAGNAAGEFVVFDEVLGPVSGGLPGEQGMVVAVAKLGTGCAPPGGDHPQFFLRAGGGAPVQVPKLPQPATIKNAAGVPVADAVHANPVDDVFVIQLFVFDPGSTWELQIVNKDDEARAFTWVAAPDQADVRQPWIEIPESLSLEAMAGEVAIRSVQVANRGTGRLVITDPPGLALESGFKLSKVPGPIGPNACGELEIQFTAPPSAGPSNAEYIASSNDTIAEHKRRLALSATTKVPAPTSVEVAVFAVVPPHSEAFRDRFAEGNHVAAMSAVFADPLPLGTIVYPPDSEAPTTPGAIQDAAARLLDDFEGPIYTRVTYLDEAAEDAVPVPVTIRDKRRGALTAATTTADRGQLVAAATDASLEVESAVFEVARLNGVTQSAMMVVEVVTPPVITGFDQAGGRPGDRFTIFGRDLVFREGDDVSVFWDFPTEPGLVSPGPFEIVGPTTPTRIVAVVPNMTEEVAFPLVVSRSDGTEGLSEENVGVSLL